jgi:hypothetical protein
LHNAEVDATVVPNKIDGYTGGYVEFQVTFPKHVQSVDAVRCMNGKYNGDNCRIVARSPNSQTLIDLSTVQAVKSICDGQPKILRVIPVSDRADFQFTHVELQFDLSSNPLLAEFPKFGENSDANLINKLQDVQINFNSSVVSLHSEDVVTDSSSGQLWQVTASQFFRDHNQRIIGWDCNARVFQPYEIQTILPTRLARRQKNTPPIRQGR